MTQTMYDSVNAFAIPANATMVAGYINGDYAWHPDAWDHWKFAKRVRIQVFIPGHSVYDDGDVLDIEAKYAPFAEARNAALAYVNMRNKSGHKPCIYTSVSTWKYFKGLPNADFWIADYTQSQHIISGTIGTQFANPGPYDRSLMVDGWPTSPPVPMPPSYRTGDKMLFEPIMVSGTDGDGNAYYTAVGVNAALVVNAVGNPSNPAMPTPEPHHYGLPKFIGARDDSTPTQQIATLVWAGGDSNMGPWGARMVIAQS